MAASPVSTTTAKEGAQTPSLTISHDAAINHAFQQNAIPVIKELRFRNDGVSRKDLLVRVVTEPAFAAPAELRIQSLDADGEILVAPLDLPLGHDFLAGLNERVSGWLRTEVIEDGRVLCSRADPVVLLAHNEWCGLASLPEILAAFILPNDPAVASILGRAAELLRSATGRAALNGYQDKSRRRAWEQVAAIYRAVAELRLRYIAPPASFEQTGQKIRFPSAVVGQRLATCLDLALLMAACCEQAGLRPFVLLHEGHACAGCWLEELSLADASTDDLQHLRKLAAEKLVTVFETTLLTEDDAGGLDNAEQAALPHLEADDRFRLALDVRQARVARILPLPIPGASGAPRAGDQDDADPDASLGAREAREARDGFEGFDAPADATAAVPAASKTATRIDLWKSKLLDLSRRNRLLNLKETKGVIRLLAPEPARAEDALAGGELKLLPRPRLMGDADPRSASTYARRRKEDPLDAFLREELENKRLHTLLDEAEHERRLTDLFRAARNALDENGTNTLFIAVGVMEWREAEHADRVCRAPLLLVPVELVRKSTLEKFSLRRLDDETRSNVTLLEMLRQHFQKEVPGLDPLPEDAGGVDVALVFQRFRDAVRELPGWEVKEELWLGQFSFAKFLLWQDLAGRLDDLTRNRVVHHLVHEAGAPYPRESADILPSRLDQQFHPREIFCPRSADSSQLAAVMAAAAGQDFVLEGPPGTGKSQTITNIIAHCLAEGKRVLFVAEKRAALDVVHRRLREDGLEPFCLELHSNKAGKADVLAQFDQALRLAAKKRPPAWEKHAEKLAAQRDALNAYPRVLHEAHPCGLSAHDCLDYLLPRGSEPTTRLAPAITVLETTVETLGRMRELARELQERARPLRPLAAHPLALLGCEELSPAWAARMLDQIRGLGATTASAAAAARALREWLRFPRPEASRAELLHLRLLADSLLAPEPVGAAFATTPWSRLAADLEDWIAWTRERAALRTALAGYDESALLALDLAALQGRWQSAQAAWFLSKWFRVGALCRRLREVRADRVRPDAERVGDTLRDALRLRELNAKLSAAAPEALACLGALWAKGEPDAARLERARDWGADLHARLVKCAGVDLAWLGEARTVLSALFAEGPEALATDSGAGGRLTRFRDTFASFDQGLDALAAELRLRRETLDDAPDHFAAVSTFCETTDAAWPRIREWCSWQRLRNESLRTGLGPVVAKLEESEAPAVANQNTAKKNGADHDAPNRDAASDDLPGFFERSFRRELLSAVIEREPVLRDFVGREHDGRIALFRETDQKLEALARELIVARLAARLPSEEAPDGIPKGEFGLLMKEIGKKTRHIPVRKLLSQIPTLLPRLKPCVLMSPLSVAQYLDASHAAFDLVIFDEASQIPVWDAVGAIARGTQLVVVGDPKQLPPTNFFNNTSDDEDDDEGAGEHKDLESILDELMSHRMRHKRLQWHYRSRHEGLIAFSNRQYYANDLLTFPSAGTTDGGVRFFHLPEARYDKGGSRTNRLEAEALVKELVARLLRSDGAPRSYGVVTFSQVQQKLVENLLDEERRKHPALERHFGDEPPVEGEPVFVKNLENVQGDERDVILFSICYGPDEAGKVSMNFGPLNRDGGERRLNVAVTRAKHEVLVFSGLLASQIDLARTRAKGVRDLKLFLDYAERGPRALAAATVSAKSASPATADAGDADAVSSSAASSLVSAESEFEQMVAERIRAAGYEVHRRVGCSGYRIDLAVVDPREPGRYLLGVECDGGTYRRAATARDRDKLRQLVLESLGWRLHRVWSTDWWHGAEAEAAKLMAALEVASRSRGKRA